MSQVRIGGMAAHFGAAHVVAEIVVFGNGGGINRVGEARPAAAGIEFVGRAEQGFAADDVHINAGFEQVVVFVAEGVFGRAVLGNLVLLFGQETFEFGSTGFFIRCRVETFALRGGFGFARQRFVGFADVDVAVAVGVFNQVVLMVFLGVVEVFLAARFSTTRGCWYFCCSRLSAAAMTAFSAGSV